MSFQYLRLDKDTLVKNPRRVSGTEDGPIFLFFKDSEDPNEHPLEVGGERADALRAWISGERTFPITENGVLDIYSGWVHGQQAARALGGDKLTDTIIDAEQYMTVPELERPSRTLDGSPRIDFRKVEKRLRGE